MTTQQSIDQAKTEAFVGKVLADTAGLAVTVMSSIGDRLGLFKQLAQDRPRVKNWPSAHTSTNATPASGSARWPVLAIWSTTRQARRFTLPPEHVPVLAQEGGPVFFGGVQEEMVGLGTSQPANAGFPHGGGVPMEAYDPERLGRQARFTSGWFKSAGAGVAASHARGAGQTGTRRPGRRCRLWAGKGADQAGPDLSPVALRGLRQFRSIHRAGHGQRPGSRRG